MTRRPPAAPRPGFTLIELLLVISIIGILTALFLGVVQRARAAGQRVQVASDISQMNAGLYQFKQEYGFYPPTTFTVPTLANDTTSLPVIQRMFPRWQPQPPTGPNPAPLSFGIFSGTLDCNQCMVFFLAGPGLQGWDKSNPTNPTPTAANKKGPYQEFAANKLDNLNVNPHFLDPWGTPYAYLQSGATASSATVTLPSANGTQTIQVYSTPLGTGAAQIARPVNGDGVQLISAGPNKFFGPGGSRQTTNATPQAVWVPGDTPDYIPNLSTSRGGDDIANFNNGAPLGVTVTPGQ